MSDNKLGNRIPFEDIQAASVWNLPSLEDGSKVVPSVKKKTAEALQETVEVIEDVTEENIEPITAEQLKKMTEEAEHEARELGFKDGQQEGFKQGFEAGSQKGEQKAYAECKTLLEDKIQRFTALSDALFDPVAMQDGELENWILDTAVNIAKHLINRELTEDPSPLFNLVEKAVASLPAGAKNIKIYLHADDVELAHEAFANNGHQWTFYTDPSLSRGGCRVVSDQSIVNYSIEHRLESMLEEINFQGEVSDEDSDPVVDYRSMSPTDIENTSEIQTEDPVPPTKNSDSVDPLNSDE